MRRLAWSSAGGTPVGGVNNVLRECSDSSTADAEVNNVCMELSWDELMNNPEIDPGGLQEVQNALEELCGLSGGGGGGPL